MNFAEDKTLFGFDPTPGIVAVEFAEPNIAHVFRREPDGSTKVAGQLMTFDLKTKERKFLTPEPLGNLDGIELDEHGHYLVSDWFNGKVFHVTADGKATTLLSMKQGTADHAYIAEKRLLILPRMMEDKLTAYELVE